MASWVGCVGFNLKDAGGGPRQRHLVGIGQVDTLGGSFAHSFFGHKSLAIFEVNSVKFFHEVGHCVIIDICKSNVLNYFSTVTSFF